MADPVLAWAGGKRNLLNELRPRIPYQDEYNHYHEPFFGGGAMYFDLEPENGYIRDINPRLMNFYQQLQQNPEQLISKNKEIDDEYGDVKDDERTDLYKEYRQEFNNLRPTDGDSKDPFREAVLFLFLNRTCWNSLYRTNQDGEFNVPRGTKWVSTRGIESKLRKGHRVLRGANISVGDFTEIEDQVAENDFIFFDPPYPPVSDRGNFKKYHQDGFDFERQIELRDLAIKLANEKDAYILITNAELPAINDIYKDDVVPDDFRLRSVPGERRINSDSTKRTGLGDTDLIITNCSPFDNVSDQSTIEEFS